MIPELLRPPGPSRVVYMANAAKIGGGGKVLMDLMLRLDRGRFEPVLVVPASGPLSAWANSHSIPYYVCPDGDWSSGAQLARRSAGLMRILWRVRPRIVHAAAPMCYRALGIASRVVRAVRVCHLGFPPETGELERAFVSGPEAVIGCYEGQARECAGLIGALNERSQVIGIPNGIDIDRFTPEPLPGEDRERWRFGARHVIAILGHLSEVKGHPTFLQAAADVARDIPDCAFVAIGGETVQPGFKARLEAQAISLGIADRVHFAGFQENVAPLLRAADIVTLPSKEEGFPLAVLEAMACGRPVVATDVGGVAEAIRDGETGCLISSGNPAVLSETLKTLIRQPDRAARLGRAARHRAIQEFSVTRFAQRVQDLYDSLLSSRVGRLVLA